MSKVYSEVKGLLRTNCEIYFHPVIKKGKRRVIPALFICSMLLVAGIPSKAQSASEQETTKSAAAYLPAREGTYQLIFNSRRADKEITLTFQELIVIEKLRKEDKVVYAAAAYSDDIRVKIFSKNIINSPNFKPVPKKYYKEEESYEEYHNIRYVELQ